MTPKQEKFCIEYLVDMNGTQAAIRAGYSERTARSIGQRLLTNVDIQMRIAELKKEHFNERIMTAEEVQARISDIARGKLEEEVVVVEGLVMGGSEARIIKKQVSAKEQLKALETLGKFHQLDKADNISSNVSQIVLDLTARRTVKHDT
ncbi:terminase small subunit [Veillonella sp.]|uniref:terminase small subunit n=1 Tax=Veillonella sp. TaxID=1926307 RepID=UPI0025F7C92A|nr:terminase small subunit [Veillonella sp.]